jgi:hypothetical protein
MAENSVSSDYLEKRMLFKKTLKVASATALWMVALLGATSAMAQEVVLPTFSAEALPAAAMTADGPGVNAPDATGMPAADIPINSRAAFYLAESSSAEPVYLRVVSAGVLALARAPGVEIGTQAEGEASPSFADTGVGTADPVAEGLGYRYTLANIDDAVSVRVTVEQNSADDAMVTGIGTGGIMASVYASRADAHFGEGTPYMSGSGDLLKVARSVTAAGAPDSPSMLTASAVSRFMAIKGMEAAMAPYEVSLGGFEVKVNGAHLAPDGMTLDAIALTGSTQTPVEDTLYMQTGVAGGTRFYSDAGFAFVSGFRFAGKPDADGGACSGDAPDGSDAGAVEGDGPGITTSPLTEVEEGEDAPDSNEVVGGLKAEPWYLCVSISNENEVEIPQGDYYMDINLAPAMDDMRPFPPQAATGIHVANIDHDGTTVQIPFVTSYENYTQRIVIVNRNKADVGFTVTFRAEGDGMIEGDNPYEGMAMGGTTTVVKVADLVTLTDPTRASATMTLLAAPNTVDVATTLVNKMDGSTDTVVLDSR